MNKEKFLLKYFHGRPAFNDERYQIIKKYADKKYKCGLERYRCLEFEILARDKINVDAIKDAIAFYDTNKEKILDTTKTEQSVENSIILTELKNKLRNLRLVEYKYYQKHEKFEHWSIDSKIYEVINDALRNEMVEYKITQFSSNLEQINLHDKRTQQNYSWNRYTEIVDAKDQEEYIYIAHTVEISNAYNNKFPDVTGFTNRFSNDGIQRLVNYKYYYPRCREYPQLTINLELNRDPAQVKELLNRTIDQIYEKYATDTTSKENLEDYENKPYNLFHFEIATKGSKSLEEKFFVYDYITYRLEEEKQKARKKSLPKTNTINYDYYFSCIEETSEFKDLEEETDKYFRLKSLEKNSEAKKYIDSILKKNSEVKKYLNSIFKNNVQSVTQEELYLELLDLELPIGKNNKVLTNPDSMKDYYEEIRDLIASSRKYNDFISKK